MLTVTLLPILPLKNHRPLFLFKQYSCTQNSIIKNHNDCGVFQCLWPVSGTQAFPSGSLYSAFYEGSSTNCLGPTVKMDMPEDKCMASLWLQRWKCSCIGRARKKKGLQLYALGMTPVWSKRHSAGYQEMSGHWWSYAMWQNMSEISNDLHSFNMRYVFLMPISWMKNNWESKSWVIPSRFHS